MDNNILSYLYHALPFFIMGSLFGMVLSLPIRSTYKQVSPHNRLININYIWLSFIPIPIVCNILFLFISLKVANSLALEYKERGIPVKHKPTYQSALILGVISCMNYAFVFGRYTWFITTFFFIVYMIEIIRTGRVLRKTTS